MIRTTITQVGVGASKPIPLDTYQSHTDTGLAAVVTGTATYSVQHTLDNVLDPNVTPTWFDHTTLTGQTATKDGFYDRPIAAVRINVTAGTGTVALTVLQPGC